MVHPYPYVKCFILCSRLLYVPWCLLNYYKKICMHYNNLLSSLFWFVICRTQIGQPPDDDDGDIIMVMMIIMIIIII